MPASSDVILHGQTPKGGARQQCNVLHTIFIYTQPNGSRTSLGNSLGNRNGNSNNPDRLYHHA
eukprot:scaffold215907_cov13-Prasinocladus_malaysianus.AAC.1